MPSYLYNVINPAGDVICRESDAMKAVVVISYSVCHVVYNGYDIVNYSGCDLRITVGVISSYIGCDDKDTVDRISNIVAVMT